MQTTRYTTWASLIFFLNESILYYDEWFSRYPLDKLNKEKWTKGNDFASRLAKVLLILCTLTLSISISPPNLKSIYLLVFYMSSRQDLHRRADGKIDGWKGFLLRKDRPSGNYAPSTNLLREHNIFSEIKKGKTFKCSLR